MDSDSFDRPVVVAEDMIGVAMYELVSGRLMAVHATLFATGFALFVLCTHLLLSF